MTNTEKIPIQGDRFFTVVYRVPADWRPGEGIMNDPNMAVVSWTHAIRDRDAAIDAARQAQAMPLDTNPIYQVFRDGSGGWSDTSEQQYDQADVTKRRIVYLVPPAPKHVKTRDSITTIGVPSVVREALDIAHDLAVAEAENVHTTYAGYKPHKHEAVDRDVATVKAAIELIQNAPDLELASLVFTPQELAVACRACNVPADHVEAISAALTSNRDGRDGDPAPRLTTMSLCESSHLGLRPNKPYIFRVHEGCAECEKLAEPYADS